MASSSTTAVTADIYKLTEFVETIKTRFIDIPDETLYLGMYGYLSSIFTNALENTAIVASEYSGEAIPTKAKFERNVIAHALSLGINKIYATPSIIQVMLCLPKDVIDNLSNNNIFTLDKDSVFTIGEDENYPFILDFDIVLTRSTLPNGQEVYTARYDIDEEYSEIINPLADYQNPYLPSIQVQAEGNTELLHIPITLRQMEHSTIYKKILVNNPLETKVLSFSYEDQIAFFYVEVEEVDSITGLTVTHYLTPIYDGIYNDDTVNYEYINYMFLDENNIRLTFNRDSYQPLSNAEVTIHIYTTLGSEANFTMAEDYKKVATLTSERFNYNKLYYYLVALSNSIEGIDQLSVDQLKTIIPKEALARGSITTYTDLNNAFNQIQTPNIQMKFLKKVDNQLERLYYSYLLLKDSTGNIVPTNTVNVYLDKTMFDHSSKTSFVIKSGAMFCYNSESDNVEGVSSTLTDAQIESKDKDSFLYMLPFLAVITKSPFYVSYYMTYINYDGLVYYNWINENSLLQFICLQFNFRRDFYPTEDTGDSTTNSNYIQNSQEVYHLTTSVTQTLSTSFDLFTYNADGSLASTKVKMFAILYKEDSNGDLTPYRYMEALVSESDDSIDGTTINFEFKFKTNDVIAPQGNYIYIEQGLYTFITTSSNGSQAGSYVPPNVQVKFFILAQLDTDLGRTYSINSVNYDLDDYIPNLTGWTLTNVYSTGDEGLDIFYDYSDICNSYIELNRDVTTQQNSYTIYKMPLVRYTYMNSESRFIALNKIIDRRRKYIQNVLLLLEDSLGIDYKFFNTYGPSRFYNIEQKKNIDRINISLKFEIKFVSKSEEVLLNNIIASIKEYIEDMNNVTDLHMPNLITYITNTYRNHIVYIKFIKLNEYDSLYQSIYKNPALDEDVFTDSQTVPEFINVDSGTDGTPAITFDIIS